MLGDSLRRSLASRKGYSLIDSDSIEAAVATPAGRAAIQRSLNADLTITPSFVGTGDMMTVLVTIRDGENARMGMRVASSKFSVSDPAPSIPAIVRLVGAQLDNLASPWTVRMVVPSVPARGSNQ